MPPLTLRALVLGASVVALSARIRPAEARPNTHAPAVSTWDTRASNIVFGYRHSLFGHTSTSILSYSANFASTSGVLLAQFGLHYVSNKRDDGEPVARGVSAGGVALFSFPLAERYSNGVVPSAFALYLGGVPTALISGRLNYLSVPGVIGIGVPLSPSPTVTLTPWVELSPGLDFDTRINEVSTDEAIDAALDGTLTEAEVEELVRQGLDAKLTTSLGARAGLSAAFHLGKRVDLDADLMLGGGAVAFGAGLVFRWDEMVPGVRGAGSSAFDCDDIDARVRACRASRRSPEVEPARRPPNAIPQAAPRRPKPPVTPRLRRSPAITTTRSNATPLSEVRPSTTTPSTRTNTKPLAPRALPKRAPAPAPAAPTKGTTAPTPPPNDAFPPLKAAPPVN